MTRLDFFIGKWFEVPAGTKQLTLTLEALPPVLANADVIVFAAPGKSGKFAMTGRRTMDNNPMTAVGPSVTIPVHAGTDYVLRLGGQAILAMPGLQDFEVGLTLLADGAKISDFGGPRLATQVNAAELTTNIYVRVP